MQLGPHPRSTTHVYCHAHNYARAKGAAGSTPAHTKCPVHPYGWYSSSESSASSSSATAPQAAQTTTTTTNDNENENAVATSARDPKDDFNARFVRVSVRDLDGREKARDLLPDEKFSPTALIRRAPDGKVGPGSLWEK